MTCTSIIGTERDLTYILAISGAFEMLKDLAKNVTYRVDLPHGQRRLKEAILYVAKSCFDFHYFGKVKLNKTLWRADFHSFRDRQVPVTGRSYQRLPQGPVPYEMVPLTDDMLRDGLLTFVSSNIPNERRPKALIDPTMSVFTEDDRSYLDEAIEHYRHMTGGESSDESHGVAWQTHEDGDLLPYESSYFDDRALPASAFQELAERARARGWMSH